MKLVKFLIVLWFIFPIKNIAQENSSISCFQTIHGTIKGKNSNKTIYDVTVKLYKENTLIEVTKTDSKGLFSFKIACGNSYLLVTERSLYLEAKKELTSSAINNKNISLTIHITRKNDCFQTITGKIIGKSPNDLPENIVVQVKDKNGELLSTYTTSANGEYSFKIDCDQEYKLSFLKKDYISVTKIDSVAKIDSTTVVNIQDKVSLRLIPCKQTFNAIVLNAETNEPIKNASAFLFKKGSEVSRINTLKDGAFSFSTQCLSKYRIKVIATDFKFEEKLVNTNDANNLKNIITFRLKSIDSLKQEEIALEKINVGKIQFKINEFKITEETALELDKIVELIKSKPTLKVVLNSHTDSRGPDLHNLNLTQKRVQLMISYILSKGIDSTRISGEGYGETKLLNDCINEKQCSEEEHQENKRIEFIILDNE